MKFSTIYQLAAMVVAVAAAPSAEAEADPVYMDGVVHDPYVVARSRAEYDASGLHKLEDLAKRHSVSKRNGWLYCGNLVAGDKWNADDQLDQLKGSKTNYFVPARSCLRVKCWNTTGVYICNDQGGGINVSGEAIWERGNIIQTHCCLLGESAYSAGQQFTDSQGGYNVLVGYANCNHSPTQPPSDFGRSGKCSSFGTQYQV